LDFPSIAVSLLRRPEARLGLPCGLLLQQQPSPDGPPSSPPKTLE
jgi:hypothetical protein